MFLCLQLLDNGFNETKHYWILVKKSRSILDFYFLWHNICHDDDGSNQ